MKTWKKVLVQLLLIVVVLTAAVAIYQAMAAARKQPERKEPDVAAPLLHGVTVTFQRIEHMQEQLTLVQRLG